MSTVKSISYDQLEIIENIRALHCPEGFECDLTYGNGKFYTDGTRPKYCFDLSPLFSFVGEACSTKIPLADSSLKNVVFDPPFLTYIKQGREHNSIMAKRFSGYWAYSELEDHYRKTAKEAARVLVKGGVFVVKCQDIIHNHKMFCTHHNMINWCSEQGFRVLDLYILVAKNRMPVNKKGKQQHARVFHSYFLVFKKEK